MKRGFAIGLSSLLSAVSPALASWHWFVDRFDTVANPSGWAFNAGTQSISLSGGNYSGYLEAADADTALPIVWITDQAITPFTGDYLVKSTTTVGVDLAVWASDAPIGTRTPALVLYSDNATPNDPSDDWAAFNINPNNPPIPQPGAGWQRAMFPPIPYNSATWPTGWQYLPQGPNAPAQGDWALLMSNVRRLGFAFGSPSVSYGQLHWTVGADNMQVLSQVGSDCFANCDGSTTPPILNVNDFVCFINRYAMRDPAANCTGYWNPPYHLGDEFQCFMNVYAAGCP